MTDVAQPLRAASVRRLYVKPGAGLKPRAPYGDADTPRARRPADVAQPFRAASRVPPLLAARATRERSTPQ